MPNPHAQRYKFIAHALDATGGFRPVVSFDGSGTVAAVTQTYLVRYPRESVEKFARRNELAFYESPLARHTSRFVGFITRKSPMRTTPHALYQAIVEDADGKGNSLDVFWQDFMTQAKARGAMLLLIDMPRSLPQSLAEQVAQRKAPVLTAIKPETVSDYALGDDGAFITVTFAGRFTNKTGETIDCDWTFTRSSWRAEDREKRVLDSGSHELGFCPVLIFSEQGDFPCFGPFSAIADLARRLFNLDSELDEILRSQTFSLLTMEVPAESDNAARLEAAKTVGLTISTSNLLVHSGRSPSFIAPPEGPANVYLTRIAQIQARIDEIGLAISGPQQAESGISLQMRFEAVNAALVKFAERMEDFERRVWGACGAWLSMTAMPTVAWPRDYSMADILNELDILSRMNENAMPREVIVAQQQRIVSVQFASLEDGEQDELMAAVELQLNERPPPQGAPPQEEMQ